MNTKFSTKATVGLLLLAFLSSGCSALMGDAGPKVTGESENPGFEVEEPMEKSNTIVEILIPPPEAEVPAGYGSADGIWETEGGDPMSAEGGYDSYDRAEVEPPTGVDEIEIAPEQEYNLRAGSVDDNEQWDDYLLYRLEFADTFIRVHDIDVTERHIIHVTNEQGLPVLGAKITISSQQDQWLTELMTYSDGGALFFPQAYDTQDQLFNVEVEKDGVETSFSLDRDVREHWVTLDARSTSKPVKLDVHFLIDATGSMSDEIYQLRNNMITISERIHELSSNPDVRFAMTTYRDRGDIYISKTFDFTPDIDLFTQELSQVYADGGGDNPESLNEGLHDAIHLPEWRIEDTISLIFLIADAPPHLDYPDDYDYAEEVLIAAQRGIKIFPLASSGLNDQGEYIFRQLAQITSAKFLFLTYGADGKPGSETPHHVEDYSVLSLDQLVVRLVEEELANLRGGDNYQQ
jgi:hypothetical protein